MRAGARRIESSTAVDGLQSVAFRNADDGSLVLLVLNGAADERAFSVRTEGPAGRSFRYQLPPGGVATFCWRPDNPHVKLRASSVLPDPR